MKPVDLDALDAAHKAAASAVGFDAIFVPGGGGDQWLVSE